jgi:exonuclease VII small subunit
LVLQKPGILKSIKLFEKNSDAKRSFEKQLETLNSQISQLESECQKLEQKNEYQVIYE